MTTRVSRLAEHYNCCLIGNSGTGKTHVAVALGQAACRHGRHVRFHTAASLVNQLEEAQKQYRLEKLLSAPDFVTFVSISCSKSRLQLNIEGYFEKVQCSA